MRQWATWPLPVAMVCTVGQLLSGWAVFGWIGRPALLLYLVLQWRRQNRMVKGLLSVSVAVALIALWRLPEPWSVLARAMDQFLFLGTFIAAVGMLRVAAMSSPLVRACGKALLRQPPNWRYPTLSMGGAVFGLIINIGVLGLLGTMVERANTLSAAGSVQIQQVRQRRLITALLRGFALVPLVSPLSVTVALVLSHMTQLRYIDLLLPAAVTSVGMFALGWALDTWTRPRHLAHLVPPAPPASLRPLLPFLALLTAIVAIIFVTAELLQVRLPVAVILIAPLSSWVWLGWQRRRLGGGLGLQRAGASIARRVGDIFGGARGEVALLGGAGFLGYLVLQLVDSRAVAAWLLASGVSGPWLAAAATFLIAGAAQLGINPIVTVTLLVGLFADPSVVGVPPVALAIALMTGWSLALISSPMTASMLVLARICRTSAYTIGYRWNGGFLLLTLLAVAIWLPALAVWLR